MTALDRDDELEAFLKSRTLLPGSDDKLEPPGALDEIVMNEAREAIRPRQQSTRRARWATPVALAATILLCLSIVLNVRLNTNRPTAAMEHPVLARSAQEASSSISAIAASAPSPPPPPAAAAAPEEPTPVSAARESARPHGWEPRQSAFADRKADVVSKAGVTVNKPAPGASSLDASPPRAISPGAVSPRPTAPSTTPPGGGISPGATPPVTGQMEGASVETLKRQQPALAKDKAAAAEHPQDPKVWLQQIAALRTQGKTAQADAEMQRFRAAFPGYPPTSAESATSVPR